MALVELSKKQIENLEWYYRAELRPGAMTQGRSFPNMQATRALLERTELSGLDVLDVGVMEGAFPVLMARAGARVTAYDRMVLADRIALVKAAYDVEFAYLAGEPFHDFAAARIARGQAPFDFVLCSGVLYHTIEPFLFLHCLKALLKPGGILLLETALAVEEDAALFFNEKGRFFPGTNFFQVSSGWLDCALRYLGFRIVDVEYLVRGEVAGRRLARAAMLCIRGEAPVVESGDAWGAKNLIATELNEFLELPPPPHGGESLEPRIRARAIAAGAWRANLQSIDLTKAIGQRPAIERDRNVCCMRLADRLGA